MKKWISKLFALLLTIAFLMGAAPTLAFGSSAEADEKEGEPVHVYTEEENAALESDVFAKIEAVKSTSAVKMGGSGKLSEADFVAMIPQVVSAIESSDTYVPGTLQRNGDFLVWETTVGIPCCYSPRMEAKLAEGAIPSADPEALAETVVTSFANRGGSPGSINVAVFQPYYGIQSSFTTQYKFEGESIAETTGGTNTTYIAADATINNIAHALETCGVVIFDSHGDTDYEGPNEDYTSRANTSYLCLTTGSGITNQDTAAQTGPYGTYYHCLKSSGYTYVDGTCMTNHMTSDSPNGLLWMAICLGMATDGLEAPLRDRGVEVVYGYSQSVSFTGDYKYEEYFWEKMKAGEDVKTAAAYMKQKVGNKDPYTNPPAYPIFVSSEDVYPGHGNVDQVQTVNSGWVLFSQYEITALSNNEEWGTVSVSGNTIITQPAVGYMPAGYEIVSGTAEVEQNGNVFLVSPSSDCTIRIIFQAREPAALNYSVPDGVSCPAPVSGYVGDTVKTPTLDATENSSCTFLGWTTEPVEERVEERPAYVKPGATVTLTSGEETLYALYSFFITEDGRAADQCSLVQSAPDSWEGDYVITYDGIKALDASGEITGSAIGGSSASRDLAAEGVSKTGSSLNNVPDTLIFRIAPDGTGAYSVKMKDSDYYLALISNNNALSTLDEVRSESRWKISMGDDGPVLANVRFSTRSLQYNATSNQFSAYLTGMQQPLSLYAVTKGTTWYTTTPSVITAQPEDVTVNAGDTATFAVEASGNSLAYQWWYLKPGTDEWTRVKNNGTSAVYTLTAELRHNGYQYRCVITDANGAAVTSDIAGLTVKCNPPVITTQPAAQTVVAGDAVTFSVEATGDALTYQWWYKAPGGEWTKVKVNGTSAVYTLTTEPRHDGYQYKCVVSNDTESVTSDIAGLTVKCNPPVITTQPAAQTVVAGKSVTFSVEATGDGLTYQWWYKAPGGEWTKVKVNGTSATYILTAQERHNGYKYRCRVTNAAGTAASDIVKLTVVTQPTITTQPTDKTVAAGKSVTFSVAATGGGLTYQWWYKAPGGEWTKVKVGGTSATYTLTAQERHNGYKYRCRVYNAAGVAASTIVKLTVK